MADFTALVNFENKNFSLEVKEENYFQYSLGLVKFKI